MVGIDHLARMVTDADFRNGVGVVAPHQGSCDACEPNSMTEKAA